MRPLYPAPGPLALDPECANLSYSSFVFPHVSEGYKKKQHHGHDENDKNSGWENILSHRLFFHFLRMQSIRLAAFCRRARGAVVPQPIHNDALYICQRVSACFAQSLRPYEPAPFTQGSLFLTFQRETVCQIRRETSATGSRGDTPGGVEGRSPPWFSKQQREMVG